MRVVDLVRYGTFAVRNPVAGGLYVQLVHDWLVGETRSDRQYASVTGASTRQVSRSWELFESWGLINRLGGTRARRIVLMPMPNLQFCRDVVTGLYGSEALESVATGITRAELCPSEGPNDPVASYAVQQLLGLYGKADLVTYAFPDPGVKTGTGSVVHADFRQNGDSRQASSNAVVVSSYNQTAQVLLSGDLARIGAKVATYPVDLPPGLLVSGNVTSPRQRSARTRKYELPDNSFALLYWPMNKIQETDVDYYDTIVELVDHWNTVFRHEERLDRKIYARLRHLLVEQQIPVEKIRAAFKAASIDKFWSQNAVLSSLINDAGRMRKLASQTTHDRYGRTMDVHPKGEVIAVEF